MDLSIPHFPRKANIRRRTRGGEAISPELARLSVEDPVFAALLSMMSVQLVFLKEMTETGLSWPPLLLNIFHMSACKRYSWIAV